MILSDCLKVFKVPSVIFSSVTDIYSYDEPRKFHKSIKKNPKPQLFWKKNLPNVDLAPIRTCIIAHISGHFSHCMIMSDCSKVFNSFQYFFFFITHIFDTIIYRRKCTLTASMKQSCHPASPAPYCAFCPRSFELLVVFTERGATGQWKCGRRQWSKWNKQQNTDKYGGCANNLSYVQVKILLVILIQTPREDVCYRFWLDSSS